MNRIYTCIKSAKMSNLKFNLIAACDSKMGIGRNNELPWRLRNEMAYFNRMTTGFSKTAGPNSTSAAADGKRNVVVMGRKTWDSIPPKFRPLKGRLNVVLSRSDAAEEIIGEDVIWTKSWEEMIEKLTDLEEKREIGKIWITGGSYIYKLSLESPYCHRIYLTRIQNDYGCDVQFPDFDLDVFQLVNDPEVPEGEQEEEGVKYNFFVYEKAE